MSVEKLKNECNYSFDDLITAATDTNNDKISELTLFYNLGQSDKNLLVRKYCNKIGWYYEDRIGSDNVVYTAFSPEKCSVV